MDEGLRDGPPETRSRNLASLAALVWLLWDYVLTVPQEYQYIWKGSINRVKILYLVSRYLALCVQLTSTVIVFTLLSHAQVPPSHCRVWYLYLKITTCSLIAIIDTVLMLRIYVLYNRNHKVGVLLVGLFLWDTAAAATCTGRTWSSVAFFPNCNTQGTPSDVFYFLCATLISQATLLSLTLAKRKVAFGQSPVVKLVVRDGACVFILVVSIILAVVPYSYITQECKPYILFIWPINILSISTGRLIMNMQKVALYPRGDGISDPGLTGTNIAFTSFINFDNHSTTSLEFDQILEGISMRSES